MCSWEQVVQCEGVVCIGLVKYQATCQECKGHTMSSRQRPGDEMHRGPAIALGPTAVA